jgi:hypothetical protein
VGRPRRRGRFVDVDARASLLTADLADLAAKRFHRLRFTAVPRQRLPKPSCHASSNVSSTMGWVGVETSRETTCPFAALQERGQVARRERRHRARFRVGLELEQRAEVRVDRLAERDLGHHEDAARNNGTGSVTPFGSMAPSVSNRSRTRSRSASNVSIFHTVSRRLQARIASPERLIERDSNAEYPAIIPPDRAPEGPRRAVHFLCPSRLCAQLLIGAFAGLMPAVRASRMPPTVALRTV